MAETLTVMHQREQIARIQRMQEETRKFVEEQHRLAAEESKLGHVLAGWSLFIAGMMASAALIGATATFIKFLA